MRGILLLAGLAISLLSGCSTLIPVPEAPDVPRDQAESAWGRVLKTYVDTEGRVNFTGLGKNLKDLELFVRYLSKTKPADLTNDQQRLAFYLNAYNALSMYNVIKSDYPTDFDGFFRRLRFFYNKKFVILGEEMSLYTFENDYVRKMGDPRVHVALNCMSTGCPRLPREPFEGARLDAQLNREANKFYNEERNVNTDATKKVVHVSQILEFFTDDFLKKAPTLIEYINRYRKIKVPGDYKIEFIPYNWTVYKQPNT
jgi:hypothetical protein